MGFFSNLFVSAKGAVLGLASGWYLYAIIAAASFGGGLYTAHIYHKAQETTAAQAIVKQVVKQGKIDTVTAVKYENDVHLLQGQYLILKGKYDKLQKKNSLITTDCKLTADALLLWNDSNRGVSSDSSTASNSSARTLPTGNAATVEFGDALKNKLLWDEYHNTIKEKLLAIKAWDEAQYGK